MTNRTQIHSRPPLHRMMLIHEKLQRQEYPNCRRLAEAMEMSAKTIQRDVDFMRDRMGLPIQYDDRRFGFFYTKPVTSFPHIEVTQGELIALFIAQKALAQYRGTPFEAPLAAAFIKISEGLQDRITFSWADLDSMISFRTVGIPELDLTLFGELSRALMQSVEITFDYHKLESKKHEPRRVRPWHLGCVDHQWYLFAYDLERNSRRTFALPRMRNVKLTTVQFERPADFSIKALLAESFGVYTSPDHHVIRIRFDAFAARLVGERRWHASQKLTALPKGEVEIELHLVGLEEIIRWILSWGDHATVLGPPELKKRMRQATKKMAEKY